MSGLAVVSGEALPYLFLLLLLEIAMGGLALLLAVDWRRLVAASYVKLCSSMLGVLAGLAWAVSLALPNDDAVGSYPLELAPLRPVQGSLAALFILASLYALASLWGRRRPALILGSGAVASGLLAVALLAWLLSPPVFSYGTLLLSLLLGSLAAGAVSMDMVWGHWYLVTPRLATRPLSQMTFFLFAVLTLESCLAVANALLPVRQPPSDLGLAATPLFWLRMVPGLLFALALTFRAWQLSFQSATQEATGLLYLAMGAVLGGEILGRALLFATAVPV